MSPPLFCLITLKIFIWLYIVFKTFYTSLEYSDCSLCGILFLNYFLIKFSVVVLVVVLLLFCCCNTLITLNEFSELCSSFFLKTADDVFTKWMIASSSAAPLLLLFLGGARVVVLSPPLHTPPVKTWSINCEKRQKTQVPRQTL